MYVWYVLFPSKTWGVGSIQRMSFPESDLWVDEALLWIGFDIYDCFELCFHSEYDFADEMHFSSLL